jgi:hypothetical protein
MKIVAPPSKTKYWIALAAVLLLSNIGTFLWYGVHHLAPSQIEADRNQYPLIDPARHIVRQVDYLPTLQPLRERVISLVESEKDSRMSVYIEFLNTGANINLNQEERYWPASLSKVPIAMAAMGAIENDVWTLDQVLTLEDEDRAQAPSKLHENPTGTKFTVRELLEALLVHSDNTAYRILLRNVPTSEIDAVREGLGLQDLFNEQGQVTAREYSRMFRALYTASYLSRANSQLLLDMLSRAEWDHFMGQVVPDSIPFPRKYGLQPETHTFLESGIVFVPNRPFLITVMIQTPGTKSSEEEAAEVERVMSALSNMSLEFFTNATNDR